MVSLTQTHEESNMAILEKITANMELTELKKFKLQKSILTLMLEWKHLEEYMDSTQHSFHECIDELQRKEDHLNSVQESVIESNRELDSVRVSIEERSKELDDKEREIVALRDKQVSEFDFREEQLGLIGELIEERIREVELREEKVKCVFEEFRVEEKRFEDIRDSIKGRIDEIRFKEMQLEKRGDELDKVRDWIERRAKVLDEKEEDFEKRLKELECKEKQLGDRVREIASLEKQISNVDPTKVDTKLELEDVEGNSSTGMQFFVKMDGKGLQSFLNQREKDHHLMAEEVYRGLQLSSDPAKLVLDAMEGFYSADPDNGEREVVRRSCVLLLEQLLRISPQIRPHVRAEAMELVWQWKAKLSRVPDSTEVRGHLYLSASYCLPIPYDVDELFGLLLIVAKCRQAPELCRLLGFTDYVPDLIRNLLKKNQTVSAVRFVSEFGLVDDFPPAILLKGFMKHSIKIVKNVRRSKSCKGQQNAFIDKKVAEMQEVVRYIIDHKLKSKYSPRGIEQCIEQLLREKDDNEGTAPPPLSKRVEQEKSWTESLPVLSNPPSTSPSSSGPVLTKLGPNIAFVLANMDGRTLQFFLNEHFQEHELMRNVVLLALQHSSDPGRLVLEAMQGLHLPYGKVGHEHFEAAVVRSSCILLLEQLMRLQRPLQPQAKAAFGLTSCFESDELLRLFEKIAPHPHVHELCQVLVCSGKNPGCVLHPRIVSEGSSLENVPLNNAAAFVNVSPAHDSNSVGVNMEEKSEVPIFHYVSDPGKLVLDAIRGCYHSNLENGADCSQKIMEKFSSLLDHLMEASPEITSRVQEEAMAFSVDWKSKLSLSMNNVAEVKAFLHLSATYKLASSVMFEVLHGLLETVSEYRMKFELYRLLNFAHKTPDYIQYLIEINERLLAIRFIYEFKLFEKFRPVLILKSHLRYIEHVCKKMSEEGDCSPEALDRAATKEVRLLGDVIGCIFTYRIKFDCKNLKARIKQIKKQKKDRKVLLPICGSIAQIKETEMKKRVANLEGQPQQEVTTKRPRLATPVTEVKSAAPTPAPLTLQVVACHENQTQAPPNPQGLPPGPGRPYSPWPYGYGGVAQSGWQYNRPDAGIYHGVYTHVITRPPTPQVAPGVSTNVIPRAPSPQVAPPYLYRPWQQP